MASTIIGSSIVIEGEITGEDELVILGTIKGRIATKDNVLIEGSSTVEADVEGETVVINGQVTGNVLAGERLDLRADGRLVGDVRARRILIAEGASFKGNVDMDV